MKEWWCNLSLSKKLHITIQLTLLIVLPLAQVWVMSKFESKMLEDVQLRVRDSATQSFLGLNAMMLSGTIGNPEARTTFFNKMASQQDVVDFHLVRAPAVRKQFGEGHPIEREHDALDHLALASKALQTEIVRKKKHTLRVVVPFSATREFHGTDCMQCHHAAEGEVLGAVSLTIDLNAEYRKLDKLGSILLVGQIVLQLVLFLLIGWLIRNVVGSVVELEKTMLWVREFGDFSRRAKVRGKDEIGQIAQVFNGFIAQIEELYQQLAAKIHALETYHDQTEEELRIGSDIMTRITDAHSTRDPAVRMRISPAAHYSGDLILIARTPSGNLHILLADAVGHGLTAAMNLLPLSQVFNAMSKKGFTVSRLAEELNSKIHRLMPVDRFIGAVLISVNFREQVIEVWNGGIPAPILVSMNGQILHQWRSRNPPLGILGEESFSSEVEVFHYDGDCQLFLFSDGLPEAESPDGVQFGKARIEELLCNTDPQYRFDVLLRSLEAHLQGQQAHDDVSLAMASIALQEGEEALSCHLNPPKGEEIGSQWRMSLTLGQDELKYLDAVPLLIDIVGKIHATAEHRSALYVILSELFNNALDHGVLQLDSTIKHGPDGFEQYLHQREQRLHALSSGSIEIEIEKVMIEGKYGIKLRVVDSGPGFDHAALQPPPAEMLVQAQHGRGLALARGLAYKLEHGGKGNECVAYYICA